MKKKTKKNLRPKYKNDMILKEKRNYSLFP